MKSTALLFLLALVIIAASVAWVNKRATEAEAGAGIEHTQRPDEREPGPGAYSSAQLAGASSRANSEPVTIMPAAPAPETATQLSPAQIANRNRQKLADDSRTALGVSGCYDMGSGCKCLGRDNRPLAVDAELCKIMAAEPPIYVR